MLNDILELVRAGFTKEDIMKLSANDSGQPQPVQQPEPKPEQQPVQQPEPKPAQQTQPDYNQFLTLIRGEFDGLKKAVQVENINTAAQPKTKSIDELADDALASIIMPKKG